MKHAGLTGVDSRRYVEMLDCLLPDQAVGVICDRNSIESASDSERAAVLVERLAETDQNWWREPEPATYRVEDQWVTRVMPIKGYLGDPVGALVVHHKAGSGRKMRQAERAVSLMVETLEKEASLNHELDSVVSELTDRYEELNLVYHTRDQLREFEDSAQGLEQLVTNCRSYLQVEVALLYLAERDIRIYSHERQLDGVELERALSCLGDDVVAWLDEHKRPLIVNDLDDPRLQSVCHGLPFRLLATPVFEGDNSVIGMLAICCRYQESKFSNSDRNLMDVMARKVSKIIQGAYDGLTGLPKRAVFEEELDKIQESIAAGEDGACLLFVNVDRMHIVNDTLGRTAGDEVLKMVADTLRDVAQSGDVAARLGGDEFLMMLRSCSKPEGARRADDLRERVESSRVAWLDQEINVTLSIGVVAFGADQDLVQVIANGEVACSSAKDHGGNEVNEYSREDAAVAQKEIQIHLISKLRESLRNDGFELMVQPIVPLTPEGHIHFETLVRMRASDGEMISPGVFIPAAERYHLMPAMDRWVVSRALRNLEETGFFDTHTTAVCAINLSGQSYADSAFQDFLVDLFADSSIRPNNICFEVTETAAIGDLLLARSHLNRLKSMGFQFSLDDFGTGLSSFTYLKTLPVDYVKIDGSFVSNIISDSIAHAMVESIHNVSHVMGLKTVAEYVENAEILNVIREIGIDYAQGYEVGRPVPMNAWLSEHR